jgi:tRNA A-37 threonylcarbamoyl transferase component Bud32/tetratricopeptide (TPR) repeat protein
MATNDARNLLHALLVQRVGFVKTDDAIEAMKAWQAGNSPSALEVFVERGLISPNVRTAIETLTDEVVRRFGDEQTAINEIAAMTMRESVAINPPPDPILASTAFFERCVLASRFEQLSSIGIGGMGEVVRARDNDLNRDVAIKRVRSDKAHKKGIREHFLHETKINASLTHPGIVALYDVGKDADGLPFSVMRLVDGDTLTQRIATYAAAFPHGTSGSTKQRLTFMELLQRFSAVCEAVEYAHRQQIVHRDLSPNNIIFGDLGENLIIDWGLATKTDPDKRGDSPSLYGRFGTLAYSSPEHAAGHAEKIDALSDVYGLGANLYFLLTHKAPIQYDHMDPEDEARAVRDVIRGVFPRPRQVCPEVPRALEAICLKAMARRPEDRYASAEALAADIKRYLADEPVSAYRDPLPVRAFRWARRHRTAVTAAGVMAATGLVALMIGNSIYRQQRDEQRRLKDVAVVQRHRAERNAAATADVVDRFLIEIADDEWARYPGSETKRLEMAKLAVQTYRNLSLQAPGDIEVLAGLGNSLRRAGNLCRVIHDLPASRRYHSECRSLLENIDAGDRADLRIAQVEQLVDEAEVAGLADGPIAAKPLLDAAVNAATPLLKSQPLLTALVAFHLGSFHATTENHRDSIGELSNAIAGFASQDKKPYSLELVETLAFIRLAREQHLSGLPAAATTLVRAVALATDLRAKHRDEPNAGFVAASAEQVAAEIAVSSDDYAAANDHLNASLAILDQLSGDYPKVFWYRKAIAELYISRASLRAKQDLPERAYEDATLALEAVADYRDIDPAVAWLQPVLARALFARGIAERALRRGDHGRTDLASAAETFKTAIAMNPQAKSLQDAAAAAASNDPEDR